MNDATLLAYIDEALTIDQMTTVEKLVREDSQLRERLATLVLQRDNGVHTLGDIWRRNRLSCPTREEIGSFLLKAMQDDRWEYIQFHIDVVGCQVCKSNLEDLSATLEQEAASVRRHKFFQSSVGRLKAEG